MPTTTLAIGDRVRIGGGAFYDLHGRTGTVEAVTSTKSGAVACLVRIQDTQRWLDRELLEWIG